MDTKMRIIPMTYLYLDLFELRKEVSIFGCDFNFLERIDLVNSPDHRQFSLFCGENPYLSKLNVVDRMEYIDCSATSLEHVDLPSEIHQFYCSNTYIKQLTLPDKLYFLSCDNSTHITNFDEVVNKEQRDIKIVTGENN
jgi:hypothetical protein